MEAILPLAISIACILVGFIVLVWSADKFIVGATAIAQYAHISPLVIGIVIVGFATSAPEYLVSILATVNGVAGISLGNIIGSNISNIALALGIPALFAVVCIPVSVVRKELPILFIATITTLILLYDGTFSRIDALFLLIIFFTSIFFSIRSAQKIYKEERKNTTEEYEPPSVSKLSAIFWLIVGISLLVGASQVLVYGASTLAKELGVSDLVIGLTIIAIGTSLPEIASSCIAVLRGETEMAFGNIVGSNLFNLLLVLGTTGVISPMSIPKEVILRDGLMMLLITALLLSLTLGKNPCLTRWKAIILVLLYIGYTVLLILQADAIPIVQTYTQ